MKSTTLLGLFFVVLSGCSGSVSTEIEIPGSALQAALDAWMPVVLTEYVEEELPAEVTLDRAEVLMSDGTDRVGVAMELTIVLKEIDPEAVLEKVTTEVGEPPVPPPPFGAPPENLSSAQNETSPDAKVVETLKGRVVARTGLRYDASSQSFYCEGASAESVVFDRLPGDLAPLIQKVCERSLDRYFSENAVYTIESDDSASSFASARLKNVTTRDGKLYVELGL